MVKKKGKKGTSVGRQTKRQKTAKDPELENEDLVGLRCEVWWDGEGDFFTGEIADYNSVNGTFVIDYDDGDQDTGLKILEFKIEGSPRKRLVRILKYRADDKAYLVKAATPPAEASNGIAKGTEREASCGEPRADSAHHEHCGELGKLGGSGDDSAKEQQGAAADPVSCGYLQSGMQEAEEARPTQEPACGSSSTGSFASSDISESNTSRKETEGGERGDTTEASGQKESADLKRVLNGADPSALEERRGEIEGKEGQAVAESNSHLRLTPSTSLGGQGQPALPTSSSRKLDDKQQSGSQNRNWDMRTPSNSTPTFVAQKRKREESEVRGLEADGSKLFLRVGVCRWASVPVLSVDPGQPGDAPLMGRIANWPSSTLLLQAHAAADGWDGSSNHSFPKPITLAPPASGRLCTQAERKKHRLADVSLPSPRVVQLQLPAAQPPQLWSDAEQPAAYYPLPGTLLGRPCEPTNDSEKNWLPTAEQISLVRQKAKAAATAQSSRLAKLKQEQQSKRNIRRSKSRSPSRSRERNRRRSRDRERSKAAQRDSRERDGRQSERERYEAVKLDAAARRRRESKGDSRDWPGSADRADDRGRKRSRESSSRVDAKEGNSGIRVIYLSDRQREIPGNRPGSRSRTGTPLPADREPKGAKRKCWDGSRSRSRSRSRGRAPHQRRSQSRSRDRRARRRGSTRSPDLQEAALRKDKAAAERHKSSRRSCSSSVALDISNVLTDKTGSLDESSRDDAPKADERKAQLATPEELLPPQHRFKRGRVFLCNSDELEAAIRKRVVGGSRPSDREEVCMHTAIFFFNTTTEQLAGIFCGEEAPAKPCSSGPFKYQMRMRVWRHGARVSAAAAKDAVGPHPNRSSRCPIPELLSEKQVRALCYEFKWAVS